jgi:tetratricopeptide (TPR) repeat protein
VALVEGDYLTARSLVESGLEIQRQLGDRRVIARSLTTLGSIAWRLRDPRAARALYEESLSLAHELGARGAVEETLNVLGAVARDLCDYEAALSYGEERLAIARELGYTWGIAEGLGDLALLARDRGDSIRAGVLWSESLTLFGKLGDQPYIAECLEGLASLAATPDTTVAGHEGYRDSGPTGTGIKSDDALRAARLFGAAAALRQLAGTPIVRQDQAEYEQRVTATRAMLNAAAFAAAWAEGRAMTLDQAIGVALDESEPPTIASASLSARRPV